MEPIKFLVNWTVVLTMPIWMGFYCWYVLATDFDSMSKKDVIIGKKWFWE